MKQWGARWRGAWRGGGLNKHTSRPWREPESPCDTLNIQVPGRPPQILGKNLESSAFLKPMEVSAESGWEPDVKNHHPQDSGPKALSRKPNPQGNFPRQRIYYLLLYIITPKLSGLKPPPFCPTSSPWLAPSSILHPQGGSLC